MAYGIKYIARVKDVDNNSLNFYIEKKDYEGNSSPINLSADLLNWQENDDEDISQSVRTHTGVLRMIETELIDLPQSIDDYIVVDGSIDFRAHVDTSVPGCDWGPFPRKKNFPLLSEIGFTGNKRLNAIIPPRVMTLGELLYDICGKGNFVSVIFPKGEFDDSGDYSDTNIMHSPFSSLIVSPFSTDKDYHYTNSTIMTPLTIADGIKAICDYYGLICHELPVRNETGYLGRSLIFTGYRYTGIYQIWDRSSLIEATPSHFKDLTVTGGTTMDFFDKFYIAGDNNQESSINAFSAVVVDIKGEDLEEVKYNMAHSAVASKLNDMFILTPIGGEFTSDLLINPTNPSLNTGVWLAGAKILGDDDYSDCIVLQPATGTAQDTELCKVKFAQHMLRSFYCNIKMRSRDIGNNTSRLGLKIKCGNYYYNFTEDEFDSNQHIEYIEFTKENNQDTYGIYSRRIMMSIDYVPSRLQPIEIILCHDPYHDVFNYTKYITEVKLSLQSKNLTKYENAPSNQTTYGIEGGETKNLSTLFNMRDSNRIISYRVIPDNNIVNVLLSAQKRVELIVKLKSGQQIEYQDYLRKYTLDSSGDKFRILSISRDYSMNTYNIVLQSSPVIS